MENTNTQTWSSPSFIKQGWNLFMANWKPWILAGLLYLVIQVVAEITAYHPLETLDTTPEIATQYQAGEINQIQVAFLTGLADAQNQTLSEEMILQEEKGNLAVGTISGIISAIFVVLLTVWVIYMALNHVRGGNEGLFDQIKKAKPSTYLRYIAVSLLVGFAVLFGFILLIIPGIILTLMFFCATYRVLEGDKVIESMKNSKILTDGNKWNLLKLAALGFLVTILGLLALGVGLLIAVPVVMLAYASAYQFMLEQKNMAPKYVIEDSRDNKVENQASNDHEEIIEVEEVEEGDTREIQ